MNTVFPAGSFKIQFRCHVFSEQVYNPSSWKRSLPSLNKWRLSTFPGLCSCPVLDYGCLFFRHVLLPLREAKITSSSPLHAPGHRGNVHSADICAVALFFSTCHVLCRWIPQQSFPSFCLAAGYFRRSTPSHSQSLTFRAGGKPLHFYATPPTTLMGGITAYSKSETPQRWQIWAAKISSWRWPFAKAWEELAWGQRQHEKKTKLSSSGNMGSASLEPNLPLDFSVL